MQARDHLQALADEQAALRRVATLVAEGTSSEQLCAAVCAEAGRLLGVPAVHLSRYEADESVTVLATWGEIGLLATGCVVVGTRWPLDGPSIARRVLDTGRPAMISDYSGLSGTIGPTMHAAAPEASMVGVPITVDGRAWGVIYGGTSGESSTELADDVESRLARFTDLVATPVSNAQARDALRGLANEQAALRRVATLVAEGTSVEQLCAAVCEEVAHLLEVPAVGLDRYNADESTTTLATWGELDEWEKAGLVVGSRWPLDGDSIARRVLDTGRPAVILDYSGLPGTMAAMVRAAAPGASMAGVPIIVEGKTWGVISAYTSVGPTGVPPVDVESRLARFTELIATAISNAQARNELHSLVEEQTALRRIATLVARGAEAKLVFDALCTETGQLVGASGVNLAQFTPDGFYVALVGWSLRDTHIPPGTRLPLGDDSISGIVARTGAPARLDSYDNATGELATLVRERGMRCTVAAPIIVEGRLWGAVIASKDSPEPFPAGAEHRVARFAELAATAISNATARSELIASRARIVAAGDEARRRIERNLHDGIQQGLIAVGLDLRAVGETIPAAESESHAGLARVRREVETVLEEVRELSRDCIRQCSLMEV
jgi:GAF domain-containing protein